MRIRRKVVSVWLACAFGLAFFLFFLHNADWGEIWAVLSQTDPLWFGAALLLSLAMYLFRALRWMLLLGPVAGLGFLDTLRITCIGFGANVLLPARAGELIKAVLVKRETGTSLSTVFATVVLERIFDLVVLLLILALALSTVKPAIASGHEGITMTLKAAGYSFFAVTTFAIIFLAALSRWTEATLRRVRFLLRPLPQWAAAGVERLLDTFITGVGVVRSPGIFGWAAVWSLMLWADCVLMYWAAARALHIDMRLLGAAFTLCCCAFAVALPQAPGFIGAYHSACEAALRFQGITVSSAKGYAIACWGLGAIPIAVITLFLVWYEGLSLTRLKSEGEKENEEVGACG